MKASLKEERIDFLLKSNFEFVKNYIVERIKELKIKSSSEDPIILLNISDSAAAYQNYVELSSQGYYKITELFEKELEEKLGFKDILIRLSKETFEKAISKLSGQNKIGENDYVILNGKAYYRNFQGSWYVVSSPSIFSLFPKLEQKVETHIIPKLESLYKPNEMKKIYDLWKNKDYSNKTHQNLIKPKKVFTTPDDYFKHSIKNIKKILKNPVSINSLEKLHNEGENYIEQVCKMAFQLSKVVNHLRNTDNYMVYLLRDGLIMAELQKTIDLLEHKETFTSQIMVSRKILSSNKVSEHYWNLIVDPLFSSLKENPKNFEEFYKYYTKSMKEQEKNHSDLKKIMKKLSIYIKKHLRNVGKKKIIIVDTGFQGSINMFVKYIIDNYLDLENQTDMFICAMDWWFYEVYKERYWNDFSFVKELEAINRSDHLYHYKKGSFEKGKLEVEMGPEEKQLLANIELIIMVIICKLMYENKILENKK